jgi:hypothetical protein
MKNIEIAFLIFAFASFALARAAAAVSEQESMAIIKSLPAYVKLQKEYASKSEGLIVDGPFLDSVDQKASARVGQKIWYIDIYSTIHDGPDVAHGWPCAFLRVNAESGKVFVYALDFASRSRDACVYLTLDEWRRQWLPNHSTDPTLGTGKSPAGQESRPILSQQKGH